MEGEDVVENIRAKSFPIKLRSPPGVPHDWGLLSSPSLEPVPPPPVSFCPAPGLPPRSAVHTLRTKVKTITERRQRGRERHREAPDAEIQGKHSAGPPSARVPPEQRCRAAGNEAGAPPVPSWQSRSAGNSSSSDDREEEDGVRVRLEIHSPPAERGVGTSASPPGQPRGLGEGASLESLLPDNSSGGKGDPPRPPHPPHSSCAAPSTAPNALSSSSSPRSPASSSSSSSRHWAPPKGFWRAVRPESLLLNGVGPPALPPRDREGRPEFKHSDSLECCLDKYEQRQGWSGGPARTGGPESPSSAPSCVREGAEATKPRVCGRSKGRRRRCSREEREGSGYTEAQRCDVDGKGAYESLGNDSDSTTLSQEFEPSSSSLFMFVEELPLSPRHEQAKRLLERARLKARSNHAKGDRPARRAHSDQRGQAKQQDVPANSPPQQPHVSQTKEEVAVPPTFGPLLIPEDKVPSPGELGARVRRHGCSPTRVRFEDESEKEAETRYLNRMRERGRPGNPGSKGKTESGGDSSGSGSDRSRGQRGVAGGEPPPAVIKEVIVVVKTCEACGSVVREPPSVAPDAPSPPPGAEDVRGKAAPRPAAQSKQEPSARPKQPLTVTFAGAFVLGENEESGAGRRSSGFGKLRRRSRKGESRLECGHGPYGPSWAQRRNSNPRSRANAGGAVSFDPGSPVDLERSFCEASGGPKEPSTPPGPMKSALKSSSKNRLPAAQSWVRPQTGSGRAGGEGCSQHVALQDAAEARRDGPPTQGTTAVGPGPCIRPSSLKYLPARPTPALPPAELWNGTPDGPVYPPSGDAGCGSGCDGRPSPRSLALSRAEDLRAELLRAEHLKAEALWDDRPDACRRPTAEREGRDGRPKLSLRRFFSSIGLNSVGKLVKGGRSSSMEHLSPPAAAPPRAGSTSPGLTHRPQPTGRLQRTPSLQSLRTVLPLAQLRKASSVTSLERRTERSTILGEVQMPYGLVPSPESPQIELGGALSAEDVRPSRMARPVGKVTQAFPDGTLLLELTRPPNEPFGFLISRGKGRLDTGVYIEKVCSGAGEGLYAGLLGIGDEIVQVNGEAVAGLTLDQVTRLMTRDSTASVRIMPCRRGPQR